MLSVWDAAEVDRFAKVAMIYPYLLSHEEQILWRSAVENKTLWKKRTDLSGNYKEELNLTNFKFIEFRKHWGTYSNTVKNKPI